MKNYIQEGNTLSLVAPAGGVVSGNIVIVGLLIAVATTTQAVGELFEGNIGGVYEFTKTTANAPAQGSICYWDNTAKEVTTVSTANTEVGRFVKAYVNGDTKAQVRLLN
jgi:predicted RecA/RadA family phage recombinase